MKKEIGGYPSDFEPASVKATDEYGLRYFRNMYTEHGRFYNEHRTRWAELRRYAEGTQDIQKYKNRMGPNLDYLNLDWSPIAVVPKFVNILVNEHMKGPLRLQCESLDKESRGERDKERNRLYGNMYLKDLNEKFKQATNGIGLLQADEPMPDSKEDADIYMELNYKQEAEIGAEMAVALAFQANDFKNVRRRVMRDLVVMKAGGVRVFYDENQDIRLKWVDPMNAIIPYFTNDKGEDMPHFGEIIWLTISELRQQAKLPEKELFKIAKQNAGKMGNRAWEYGNYYSNTGNYQYYDDYRVKVMYGEFFRTNTYRYEIKKAKNGSTYAPRPRSEDYESKKGSKMVDRRVKDVYCGFWVVDTKHIWSYGKKENMTRKSMDGVYSTDTTLGFKFFMPEIFDMENMSLVEKMRPFADELNLIHLKMQQHLSKAKPPGIAADIAGMEDVLKAIGKEGSDPLELQDIFEAVGNWYYSSIREDGQPLQNQRIIQELQGGLAPSFDRFIVAWNQNLQNIRDITGVNEPRDGTSPDAKTLVGTQQLALKASNNATWHLDFAMLDITERSADEVFLMSQDLIRSGRKIQGFVDAIGKRNTEMIEIGDEILREMGIRIEAGPDTEDMMYIQSVAEKAVVNGELRPEDAILIRDVSKESPKLANRMFMVRRAKYQKDKAQEAAQNAQFNAQTQKESAAQKVQGDIAVKEATEQAKQQTVILQDKLEKLARDDEHMKELERMKKDNEYKLQQIAAAGSADLDDKTLGNGVRETPIPDTIVS